MYSSTRLTRSFRTLSFIMYLANISVTIKFMLFLRSPLSRLDAWRLRLESASVIMCILMLMVATRQPTVITNFLERTSATKSIFTFRSRYICDIIITILLFNIGKAGIIMGVITLVLIFSIRFLGTRHPDAFKELFNDTESVVTNDTQDHYQINEDNEVQKHTSMERQSSNTKNFIYELINLHAKKISNAQERIFPLCLELSFVHLWCNDHLCWNLHFESQQTIMILCSILTEDVGVRKEIFQALEELE